MTSQTILNCVLAFLKAENRIHSYLALKRGPYFLAIQGVQGSGKTTLNIQARRAGAMLEQDHHLAKQLAATLRAPPWSLPTVVISIDDFYLTNKDQTELAARYPDNPFVQHRGQPSTHDLELWKKTFETLKQERPTAIPQYDKSCFNGKGDRVDPNHWDSTNEDPPVKVVIFEGWNVGFSGLTEEQVKSKWEAARQLQSDPESAYTGQLAYHKLEDLLFINKALCKEEQFCEFFQDLVQLDSRLTIVYKWRLQQETELRASRGSGMTDEQVKAFINGYYPSYELYTEGLSKGQWRKFASPDWREQHLGIRIDDERQVQDCSVL